MSKQFTVGLLLLALLSLACLSESAQLRRSQRLSQRARYFARQQLATDDDGIVDVVTPYPSADELKPEVPFEETPTPDEVYGPPEQTQFSATPDEVYGPPEITENTLTSGNVADSEVADPASEPFPPVASAQQARLIAARRRNARLRQQIKTQAYRQRSAARSAKLRSAPRRL